MKAVIAIDSFKGSLSSLMAGAAVSEGIKRVYFDADTRIFPVADGGEGTVDALVGGLGGEKRSVTVCGPLGKKVNAEYGTVGDTAIMEMAAAAGITLLCKNELNPMKTTTFGVGEMIKDAVKNGCRKFIIGIGGSATNDGGMGMLQALGFDFLDKNGNHVAFGAEGLCAVQSVSDKNALKELGECKFYIACDVENPLCGELGCSRIFAPQKGADEKMTNVLDEAMLNYAKVVKEYNPKSDMDHPGAGAAGGLGFAFLSFLDAKLEKGTELIFRETGVEKAIETADIVVTGEGRLDLQTVMGKAPVGVAKIAKKYNKPVLAFAGGVTKDAKVCNEHGIDALFPIVRGVTSLDEAMDEKNAYQNLADTAEQVFRVIRLFK